MKETDLQKKLVDAFNECGGHALKATNQFLVGVPDISMKLQGLPHAYNEVKLVPKPAKSPTVPVALTPLQRQFLKKYRAAGGLSIYTIFMKDGTRWKVYLGRDLTLDKVGVAGFIDLPRWVDPSAITAVFQGFLAGMVKNGGR